MNIIKQYATQSDCYNTNRKITPAGIMIHSTATPGVMAADFAKRWDKPGMQKGVHFFVDDKDIYQILPCELGDVHRAWHCGKGKHGSGNDTLISMEICEPKDLNDSAYFEAAYHNAVMLAAWLCGTFGILPSNVITHAEGHQAGIASNHSDVLHWFPRHGRDMDDFREDVANCLPWAEKPQDGAQTKPQGNPQVGPLYRVQVGAFRVKENAERLLQVLLASGYDDAYIKVHDGLYRVQVGAFRKKDNAQKMKAGLENAGFATYLVEYVSAPADVAYAEWPAICNTQGVNVRTGAGTDHDILVEWPKLGKGNEVDVVGEHKDASGNTWYEIVIANEHTGFVFGGYLDHA